MRSTEAGPNTRTVTDTAGTSHPSGMPPATTRGTPASNRGSIFTVNSGAFAVDRRALAMDRVGILRMHGRLIRPVSVAHESAKFEPVVVRNFTPALAPLMQRDNIVKALPSGVRQQMRFF